MNVWVTLFAFGVIIGVVTCGGYNGRRPKPGPLPKPLPLPQPKPKLSDCLVRPGCGGFVGAQCPSGYICRYRPGTDIGDCCRAHPKPLPLPKPLPVPVPKPIPSKCLAKPLCGGFAGVQCPLGYTCKYRPGADFGDCCPAPADPCHGRGQDGICGGIAGLQCRPGTKCTSIGLDGIPDGHGVCCITEPIIKPPVLGKCPPPSGLATICMFDPKRNCLSDEQCGKGYRCCIDGCGRVCKRVVFRRG